MREPKNTCPLIDESIYQMKEAWEEIRGKNLELREWGHHWLTEYEELEASSQNEIQSLNDTVSDLEEEIRDLKEQIKYLEMERSA